MDNLSVGKMPLSEPDSRPPPITPKGPYDLQATFVCSIKLSAKNLYKLLKKKVPPKVDIVNFYLSNSKISICSAVSLKSANKHITIIVPTNAISFGVSPGEFGFCMRMMIPGKEIHRIGWPNQGVPRNNPLYQKGKGFHNPMVQKRKGGY
ncbi:hypothetical protein MKX03_037022 [Papaver bracteatum]|nr:hypothetical protein MKX03_037022 [Papaver bracteatum]